MKKYIDILDKETIKRYNKRFDEYGISAKTLGWGSKKDQLTRFKTATTFIDFTNKSILDIGCGFSDFYDFIIKKNIKIKEYKGIDINKNLINVSRKKYPKNKYEIRNILLNNYDVYQADIVTLFGLLNFKLNNINNLDYTKKMINESWKITKKILIIDFLSIHLTKDYPKENFVYYHDPKDILDICFELSNNIILIHDYLPIPQKEFMIIMKKESGEKR